MQHRTPYSLPHANTWGKTMKKIKAIMTEFSMPQRWGRDLGGSHSGTAEVKAVF